MPANPILGQVTLWSGATPPRGWLPCDGRFLTIVGNEALFSVIGILYGGNGRTVFALPHLATRTPIGKGAPLFLNTLLQPGEEIGFAPLETRIQSSSESSNGGGASVLTVEGSADAVPERAPYLGVSFIICVDGEYPTRGGLSASGPASGDPMVGEIMLFAGDFAPAGYANCDGSSLDVSQYSDLFSVLGDSYGSDSPTTFKLPNLIGSYPVGAGAGEGLSPRSIGDTGGQPSFDFTTEFVSLSPGGDGIPFLTTTEPQEGQLPLFPPGTVVPFVIAATGSLPSAR